MKILTIIAILTTVWPKNANANVIYLEDTPGEGGFFDVVEGRNFRLPCISEEPAEREGDLKWTTVDNTNIDSASPSRFTIALRLRSGQVKRTLIFMNIQPHDEGTYYCQLYERGELVKRIDVNIRVSKAIAWSSNATELGGKVGDPLTVDCGTKSNPEADIEAYDQFDRRLEESELKFVRANNEFTVPKLTDDYQNALITCSAFVTMTNKVTTVVSKTVRIRVWKKPSFKQSRKTVHAVPGQTARITCGVESSVPAVTNFQFMKDGAPLETSSEYRVDSFPSKNYAVLTVEDVQDDDLGQYECVASNGILLNQMVFDLMAAKPPKEPHVSFIGFANGTTTWRIENADHDDLPVLTYSIRYAIEKLNSSFHHNLKPADHAAREWLRQNHHAASEIVVKKQPTNIYQVGGLFKERRYMFEFTPRNSAGTGESFYVTVSLANEITVAASMKIDAYYASVIFFMLSVSKCFI